jgi:hypothetical protein
VRVRDLATGAERTLTPAGARDGDPAFSPDGAWLAVSREAGKTSSIAVVRVSDGSTRVLAPGRLPRWLLAAEQLRK